MSVSRISSYLTYLILFLIIVLFLFRKYENSAELKRQKEYGYTILSPTAILLGTKMPYPSSAPTGNTPPPGFTPVFINYVGRHGARFLTSSKDILYLQQILSKAEKQGDLTEKGHRLKGMLQHFREIGKGNYGDITLSGKEEQEGIGRRMYQRYTSVFKGNGLNIEMTQKVRTQQSERAFLKGFSKYPFGKIQESLPPDSLDDDLRFFDISQAYKRYKKGRSIRLRMDSLDLDPRMRAVGQHIGEEIFKKNFREQLDRSGIGITTPKGKKVSYGIDHFVEDLYGLYAIQFSMQQEIQKTGLPVDSLNFGPFFKPEDLRWLAFVDGAEDFLEKGPAEDTLGIQIRDAVPLLVNFIKSTDYYINNPGSIDANLRFAHAETISPFATLLGIRAASSPSSSILKYNKYWQPSKIIPLSANIQWILYAGHGRYLIKVLLNEKEAKLPVRTNSFPYYDWQKVKNYYLGKLALLHVRLDDNMHRYLLDLR